MSNSPKRIVRYRELKWTYELSIQGFDEEDIEERKFLLDMLKYLSMDKPVFMSFFMGSIDTINKQAVMFSYDNPNKRYSGRLQIDIDRLIISEQLFENRNTAFYIFNQKLHWNDFLKMKDVSSQRAFKETKLAVVVNIYDLDGLSITLKKTGTINLEDVLEKFRHEGYLIKKIIF
ncbi:hypothetical protein [uncultured Enterococcus sp.]|uniref:hypothetical protein n=1 Tax=uncultured Enterococcus sp. TaxID=167972 RepID=UPI002AA72305|nr:hypothetical protein [uncultured Enterococcus sp.]